MMEPANLLYIESLDLAWADKDVVLLHACFQLLTDAIEKENLFTGDLDWDFNESSQKAKLELQELYHWWKERRTLTNELEKERYEKDTEMLTRLIKIRGYLWT